MGSFQPPANTERALTEWFRMVEKRLSALERTNPARERYSAIGAAETTTSASFVKLGTPDEITGIRLPANGVIFILARAVVKVSAGSGQVSLFLDENEIATATGASVGRAFTDTSDILVTSGDSTQDGGMFYMNTWTQDVATGQAFVASRNPVSSLAGIGILPVFADAGSHDVSLRYNVTGGNTLTAKNRKLLVWTPSAPAS